MFTDDHLASLTREERARLAHRLAELAAAEQAAAGQAGTERAVPERATAAQAIAERATAGRATAEAAPTEPVGTEPVGTERAATERAATEPAAPEAATRARPAAGGRPAPRSTRRRWLAVLALAACAAMIPWTARLATTLPEHYVTQHWSITWVGFDSVLVLSFAVTAWATLRGGRAVWAATAVTATLLLCDAWFDITTASTAADRTASAVAGAAEVVLAALLLYLARHPSGAGQPRRLRVPPAAARRWAAGTPRPTGRGPHR